MKTVRAVIIAIVVLVLSPMIVLAQDQVEKEVCLSAFGYKNLDEMQKDLLIQAKRMAVDELFGELISSYTAVDDFVLSKDQIRASSVGLLRIDGSATYYNGENLGEICIGIKAYTTPEDRAQFDPVPVTKKYCESDSRLTTRQVQEKAKRNAIIQALLDYNRQLDTVKEATLLRLVQRVEYTDSAFVPDTETYCTTVTGYIVPVQIRAVLDGADIAPGPAASDQEKSAPAENRSADSQELEAAPGAEPAADAEAADANPASTIGLQGAGGQLADQWVWIQGDNAASRQRLVADGKLELIAGPRTDFWDNRLSAPRVETSLVGDSEFQVRVDFQPKESYQTAGFVLHGAEDVSNRIEVRRYNSDGNHGIVVAATTNNRSQGIASIPYAKETTYMRVTRLGNKFTFAVSENGVNWVTLVRDYDYLLPDETLVGLYTYSTSGNETVSEFSELQAGPPQPLTAATLEGEVPFANVDDPTMLDSIWSWMPGSAVASSYSVDDGKMELIAGPRTDFWDDRLSAPRVEASLVGDSEFQVRVHFQPKEHYQAAGFVLHGAEDVSNRLEVRRYNWQGNHGIVVAATTNNRSQNIADIPYAKETAYMRVTRTGNKFAFAVSENGVNWVTLVHDYDYVLPDDLLVGLYTYSTSGNGTVSEFSELQAGPPQPLASAALEGQVPFANVDDPTMLDGVWGWMPGSAVASSYSVNDGKLRLIAGPRTNTWDGDISAPRVFVAQAGDFVASVRVDFDPKVRWQVAGIEVFGTDSYANRLAFRFYGDEGSQTLDSAEALNNRSRSLASQAYTPTTVYLRMSRDGSLVTFAYSENGVDWQMLQEDYISSLPDEVAISLFVHSTSDVGASAMFSDFQVTAQ